MNEVLLKGYIKDIEPSHTVGNINFSKARLLVPREKGIEDVVDIKFKSLSNPYKENDLISIKGNVRSYSHKVSDTKNKVEIYVFTYFDNNEQDCTNSVSIDGRICKIEDLRQTKAGKHNLHFILANNIISRTGDKKLNAYIPCIVWGNLAEKIATYSVGTKLNIKGEIRCRSHKVLKEDGSYDINIAHEVLVKEVEVLS